MCGREIARTRFPSHVSITLGIDSDAEPKFVAAAAQISGVGQNRINDQRPVTVIGCDLKLNLLMLLDDVFPIQDLCSPQSVPFCQLVDHRLLEDYFAVLAIHHQITLRVHAWRGFLCCCTLGLDIQRDLVRIGARLHHKIILKLSLVAVVDQVYARINVLVFHLGIAGHIRPPLLRIIPDEVVRFAGQFFETGHLGRGVCSHKLHVQNRRVGLRAGRWNLGNTDQGIKTSPSPPIYTASTLSLGKDLE